MLFYNAEERALVVRARVCSCACAEEEVGRRGSGGGPQLEHHQRRQDSRQPPPADKRQWRHPNGYLGLHRTGDLPTQSGTKNKGGDIVAPPASPPSPGEKDFRARSRARQGANPAAHREVYMR